MTKDAVGYPYEIDMGYKIDRQDAARAGGQLPPDYVVHDADHPDVQKAFYDARTQARLREINEQLARNLWKAEEELAATDPWVNGQHALAALVWGLILLITFGVGAGP